MWQIPSIQADQRYSQNPPCQNQKVCKCARVSLVYTDSGKCGHALYRAYIIVISVFMAGSVL